MIAFGFAALLFAVLCYFGYFFGLFFSNVNTIFFIAILLSLLLYLLVSVVVSSFSNGAEDYYAAGHSVPGIVMGCMFAEGFYSTGMFLGDAAWIYQGLFIIFMLSTIQSGGYFIGNAFFGRYIHRTHSTTIAEYMTKRFCSKTAGRISAALVIIMLSVYIFSAVLGVGTLMSFLSDIDEDICITLTIMIIMGCVILSGNKGVAYTGTSMLIFTLFGSIIGAACVAHYLGGWNNLIAQIYNSPLKDAISWKGTNLFYGSVGRNYVWGLIYALTYFCVTSTAPWQIRGFLLAKNEKEMAKGVFFGSVFVFLIYFFVAMLAVFVNKSPFPVLSPAHAVLSAPGYLMPLWASMLFVVGIIAAGMSSAALFLAMIGTYIANDFIGKRDENGELNTTVGRVGVLLVCVVIWVVISFIQHTKMTIFGSMVSAGEIAAGCCMPVAFASVWSKKLTKKGVMAGSVLSFVTIIGLQLYYANVKSMPNLFFMPTVIGIIVNLIAMAAVSRFTEITPEETAAREALFVIPEEEKTEESKKSILGWTKASIWVGVFAALLMIVLWAYPVLKAKG